MQQIPEQYGTPLVKFLDPTQDKNAMRLGCFLSEGLTIKPFVGPDAHIKRSY